MPTVLAIDNSISMHRKISVGDEHTSLSRAQIAKTCAVQIIDHLSVTLKLEHLAILSFSSNVEELCGFTRDQNLLASSLNKITIGDVCCFETLVSRINQMVLKEWGCMEMCKFIVITDGRIMWPSEGTVSTIETLFEFPTELHLLCLETMPTLASSGCLGCLEKIVKENKDNGSITSVVKGRCQERELVAHVTATVERFLKSSFTPFVVNLCCGNLESKVTVFPSPRSQNKAGKLSDDFQTIGFLHVSDVGNPPVLSRHLLLPVAEDEEDSDVGMQPSFSVVLHGSLKVENKIALVKVAEHWFGIVYSWGDSKTKSNLTLSLLEPGYNVVPWIGDIRQLGPSSFLKAEQGKIVDFPTFPVQSKKGIKRSYAQPTVAWTRATGLQTDVQKILRSAKKLPEKSPVFYKDLNRLRRAALSFGFHELLEGMSSLLERECTLLPGTAHPEATLQLSHAARELKSSINKGYNYSLEPLKTDFKFNR